MQIISYSRFSRFHVMPFRIPKSGDLFQFSSLFGSFIVYMCILLCTVVSAISCPSIRKFVSIEKIEFLWIWLYYEVLITRKDFHSWKCDVSLFWKKKESVWSLQLTVYTLITCLFVRELAFHQNPWRRGVPYRFQRVLAVLSGEKELKIPITEIFCFYSRLTFSSDS